MPDETTGQPTPVDETGYDPARHVPEMAPEGQEEDRWLALNLTRDPDARAAARFYAARVGVRRPNLARDLLQVPGVDDLRPGERYVEPGEVDLEGFQARHRG